MELTCALLPYFTRAGWHAGWHCEVPEHIPFNHPANLILQQFGGIHVRTNSEDGVKCATADIEFRALENRSETIVQWQNLLSTHLIGIALASETYEELWVASDKRVFASNDITDDIGYVGGCFTTAVLNMLTGVRHRPMFAPGKTRIMYYGEHYHIDDPRAYDWEKHVG